MAATTRSQPRFRSRGRPARLAPAIYRLYAVGGRGNAICKEFARPRLLSGWCTPVGELIFATHSRSRRYCRASGYSAVMSESRCTAAMRAAGSFFFCPATAQIDRLHVATRVNSLWFNAAAVTGHLQTHFGQMYRPCRAGLPPYHLAVGHRAFALHAASSVKLCS